MAEGPVITVSERREETLEMEGRSVGPAFSHERSPQTEPLRSAHVCVKKMAGVQKSTLSSQEIRQLAGPVGDQTVIAILETGASLADVEVAVIHARGEGEYDVTGHTLSGTAALMPAFC